MIFRIKGRKNVNTINRIFIVLSVAMFVVIFTPVVEGQANEVSVKEIISPVYEEVRDFSEGLAAVKKNGLWGYIDEKGNVVLDFKYLIAHSFSEEKAVVLTQESNLDKNGRKVLSIYWGFIDRKGNITPLISTYGSVFGFDDIVNGTQEDLDNALAYYKHSSSETLQFYNGYLYGTIEDNPVPVIIDTSGHEILNDVGALHYPTEGMLATHFYDQPFYYDMKGNILFKDKQFAQVRPFNKGHAPVGFYDENGELYYTIMDKNGTVWKDLKFQNFYVRDLNEAYSIFNDNNLASIQHMNGQWGAINLAGDAVIPYQYELLSVFTEGVAPFKQNGKYGYVDIHGHEIIQAQFDEATGFYNGLAIVKKGNAVYFIDQAGNKVNGLENSLFSSYVEAMKKGEHKYIPSSKIITIERNNKKGFAKVQYNPKVTPVTAISIDNENVMIKQGDDIRLKPIIAPVSASNKVVSWSSSNPKVATVDEYGKVKGIALGTATITVITEDGKHSASTTVSVNPYADYRTWSEPLQKNETNYSWRVRFSQPIDAKTVTSSSVYVVDQHFNKVSFLTPTVQNSSEGGTIILTNNGYFNKNEVYWIIIEKTVKSESGKRLSKGMKAQFTIQ